MDFEWDEDKRLANLEKHGMDFEIARTIWDRHVLDPAAIRETEGESRRLALGVVREDETIIAVVSTVRGDRKRLISARRARHNERQAYQDEFGFGS